MRHRQNLVLQKDRDLRRRRESKSGEYLHKSALFKVFVGGKIFKFPFRAPANQAYSEENILSLEERVIEHIEKHLSRLEFRRVQVGPNAVNFIATGTKPPQGEKNEARIGDDAGSSEGGVRDAGTPDRNVRADIPRESRGHGEDAEI
jgi:hypothetical protein